MARGTVSGIIAACLLVALVIVAAVLPVPYVTFSPGPTVDVLADFDGEEIVEISGAKTYRDDGALRLATNADRDSDVGSYRIRASGLASGNYAIAYADGALRIDPAALGTLEHPVLVVVGERDAIRPEHTALIVDAIPHARLVIVPGMAHDLPPSKTPEMVRLIAEHVREG